MDKSVEDEVNAYHVYINEKNEILVAANNGSSTILHEDVKSKRMYATIKLCNYEDCIVQIIRTHSNNINSNGAEYKKIDDLKT